MTRYALIAALVACLGLVAALWWVSGQRDDARATAARLERELAVAQTRITQFKEAAEIHTLFIARIQSSQQSAQQAEDAATTAEGANEPLPDYLRAIIDGL